MRTSNIERRSRLRQTAATPGQASNIEAGFAKRRLHPARHRTSNFELLGRRSITFGTKYLTMSSMLDACLPQAGSMFVLAVLGGMGVCDNLSTFEPIYATFEAFKATFSA